MKFLYKIHSGYDGFYPARISDRVMDKRFLPLGWTRYLDEVSRGDEVWVYFRGPHRFEDGVYAKGHVASVDLTSRRVMLRLYRYRTDRPVTDRRTSERVATIVSPRYRQVFLLPTDWETVPYCDIYSTAESCAKRKCEWCPTWKKLPIIGQRDVGLPQHVPSRLHGYAPAYWAIPPRCYISSRHIQSSIHMTSQIMKAFKTGNQNLAHPLAAGMFEALQRRDLIDFDCIVPVPLSPDKARMREIHRTRLLAIELRRLLGTSVREIVSLTAPISKRKLLSAGRTYSEFQHEYSSLLSVRPGARSVQRILLVDDVCTHGGTFKAICEAVWRVNATATITAAAGAQMIVKAVLLGTDSLLI